MPYQGIDYVRLESGWLDMFGQTKRAPTGGIFPAKVKKQILKQIQLNQFYLVPTTNG
jgi:hypothetical protein